MLSRAIPLFVAVIALFALFGAADASPMQRAAKRMETAETLGWTNSKRMAAGYPPRSPKFNFGTPTVSKRQYPSSSPSPSPSSTVQTFSGRIMIKTNVAAPFIGYVSGGSPARVDVKGAYGGDLEVQFTTQLLSKVPVNLEATNGNFSPVYIGGATDGYLSAHSSSSVPITNVPATLAYERPTSEGASSIWVFDYRTHQLIPRWTNIDGGAPDIVIGYNWHSNELFLTGDLAVYNAATGNQAIAVEFYLTA